MIDQYLNNLIINLPKHKKIIQIDLILSGGLFNGCYTLGALYYLKKLEKKNIIHINRISCSSVGSILGLLYIIDKLDLFYEFYQIFFQHLHKQKNLSILFSLKKKLYCKLPQNFKKLLTNKLFISYTNIQTCKKYIKSKFTSKNKIINYLIRSCYVPYLIDYNPAYKNKYIDGMLPHFFQKQSNTKILYINVFTPDKLSHMFNIKNEHNITHRIVSGINDIHMCFLKNQNTLMCSFLHKWNIYEYLIYYFSFIIQFIILHSLHINIFIINNKNIKLFTKYISQYIFDNYFFYI